MGRDGGARMLHHDPDMQRGQHRVIKRLRARVIVVPTKTWEMTLGGRSVGVGMGLLL